MCLMQNKLLIFLTLLVVIEFTFLGFNIKNSIKFYNQYVGKTVVIKQLGIEGLIFDTNYELIYANKFHVRFTNKLGAVQELVFKEFEVEIK